MMLVCIGMSGSFIAPSRIRRPLRFLRQATCTLLHMVLLSGVLLLFCSDALAGLTAEDWHCYEDSNFHVHANSPAECINLSRIYHENRSPNYFVGETRVQPWSDTGASLSLGWTFVLH